jgi:hypothetical protein
MPKSIPKFMLLNKRKKKKKKGDREERVGKKEAQNLTHTKKKKEGKQNTHCEYTKLPKKLSN